MSLAAYVPNSWAEAAALLRGQLTPYPGRINLMLRSVLACAIVIVTSMTLQVPALAVSILCVLFVTQSNVVVTRMIGVLFMIGSTLAIGLSIVLLKFTFDYPLIRIVSASVLFFVCVYLMRVLKIGPMFYLCALVVIYVQSFVDQTDQADILVRLTLWTWVAVNYPIALTLLINTLFLPVEPMQQLTGAIHGQLAAVEAQVTSLLEDRAAPAPAPLAAVQQSALTLQKLLGFATMRDAHYREKRGYYLACIATVSRLYAAAGELAAQPRPMSAAQRAVLQDVLMNCRALDAAVATGRPYRFETARTHASAPGAEAGMAGELWRALHAFGNPGAVEQAGAAAPAQAPMVAPDAWTNPAYARFALKTLLAVLLCYVFYNAADWQGIHTIMLTCLIVALPNLGGSARRSALRIAGAATGSLLALFMVVFVVPHLDGIAGLLMISLPVVALGTWIAAGPETISYAGTQIVFTFSLALIEQFGPTTNLTDIRDRMLGIMFGVIVATVIQSAFWRESEGDALRTKLAAMLRAVAALLSAAASRDPAAQQLPYSQLQLKTWSVFSDCGETLARVALEPGWQDGVQESLALRAQRVLAGGRELMVACNALYGALTADASMPQGAPDAAREILRQAAAELTVYAENLAQHPPDASAPALISLAALTRFDVAGSDGRPFAAEPLVETMYTLVRELADLPNWRESPQPEPILRESHGHE